MVATTQLPCMREGCQNEGTKIIFIGNNAYPICKECYRWLGKLNQLILEEFGEEAKKKGRNDGTDKK